MSVRAFRASGALGALVFGAVISCTDGFVAPRSDRLAGTRDGVALAKFFWTEPIDLGLLPVPVGAPYQSFANALNDKDEVVGRSAAMIPQMVTLALGFRWTPDGPNAETGQLAVLQTPGGAIPEMSDALDINDKGVAVGWIYRRPSPVGVTVGVIWPGDVATIIGGDQAVAINNSGYVVLQTGSTVSLWVPDSPNATTGQTHVIGNFLAYAINDRGVVVGRSYDSPGHAVVWQPDAPGAVTGTLTQLLEAPSVAYDVNNKGEIVGDLLSGKAFLWQPRNPNATAGDLIELNPLIGATYATATGINERGEIAGRGFFPTAGFPQSWVWSPGTNAGSTGTVMVLGRAEPIDYAPSIAPDINDRGDVASMLNLHATLWRK